MISAIYARKSTEQSAVADEAKSVARQINHAKDYAARRGWTTDDRYVFTDDGISGAEFGKRRPGFLRLINALKPKPEFQVLVMSEESRLGREQIQTAYALQQITDAGVRVWFYLTDQERKLDTATDKVMLSLTNFAAEMEREKAQLRTYDALVRKAKAGFVCGGVCFGYDNVTITGPDGKRSHVEYRINEAEAAVVRQIFALYCAGHGFTTIAKTLNSEQALCPKARPLSRPAGWAASSIREVLLRPLYHGQRIWSRTKKRLPSGVKKPHKRAEQDWITIDLPHLRIIDDATWQEAQARWNNVRAVYLRGTNGRLHGRPTNGRESPYLLTGFTVCGHCGGSVYVRSRSHGSRRAFHYCCVTHYQRGPESCGERLLLPVPDVDRAILTALERDVLNPAVVAKAIEKAIDQLQSDREDPDQRREVLTKELHHLETELARFTQAIAAGGSLPTIMWAIQERETRRVKMQAELALLNGTPIGQVDAGQVEQELRGYLKDWSSLTSRHPAQTRQILRKLLPSRIRLSHDAEGSIASKEQPPWAAC
jgi:DNA invertase Pin-like site-specific DNA recombinase